MIALAKCHNCGKLFDVDRVTPVFNGYCSKKCLENSRFNVIFREKWDK